LPAATGCLVPLRSSAIAAGVAGRLEEAHVTERSPGPIGGRAGIAATVIGMLGAVTLMRLPRTLAIRGRRIPARMAVRSRRPVAFLGTFSIGPSLAASATVFPAVALATTVGMRRIGRERLVTAAILARNGLARGAFDGTKEAAFVTRTQRDGNARRARPARAADAVDVDLGHFGELEVHDVAHLVDVDATGSDVGCDENPDATCAEGVERDLALVLAFVAVNRGDLDAAALEMACDTVRAALGAREDEAACQVRIRHQLGEQGPLPRLVDMDDALGDLFDGRRNRRHGNLDRIAKKLVGQPRNFARHRRREEQVLAGGRKGRDHLANRLDEAEIEHLIGLVEDEHLGVPEIRRPLSHVIEQAAGRRNQDVEAACQSLTLRPIADAAEHHGHAQVEVPAVGFEAFRDLGRKLARRRENENASTTARSGLPVVCEAMQNRQGKGGGLAGAGLRDAEQVAAGEEVGNGLGLDGGWRLVAFLAKRLENRRCEAEIVECRHSDLSGMRAPARASTWHDALAALAG
jgi:hypothetical protein